MEKMVSLKKFKDEIEERLSVLDLSSLKELIKSFSDEVKPTAREEFLVKLFPSSTKEVVGDDILEELDGLREVIESRFEEEPDCDDYDYDVEDPGPDADLVEKISLMFERVNSIFDYGNVKLARKAYEKLLNLFDLEDDYGRTISSYDLENVDLKEIRARYLRSLYLSLSGRERMRTLIEQMESLRSFSPGNPTSIEEIIEISREPLPRWSEFLEEWIAFLKQENGRCINAWLREAVFLKQGISGLKDLALSDGLKNPRVFYEIIQYFKNQNQIKEALDEAKKALSVLPEGLPIRAAIADQMLELSFLLNDNEALCQARWISFQEKPTLEKLLELFHTSDGKDRQVLMEKAVHVLEQDTSKRSYDSSLSDRWEIDDIETPSHPKKSLLLHAYFFSGKGSSAFNLIPQKEELGWSYGEQPIFIAVYLFQIIPALKISETSKSFQSFWRYSMGSSRDWDRFEPVQGTEEKLSYAYEKLKKEIKIKIDPSVQDWCFDISKKRIFSIVSNKHRRGYGKAALLTAVCHDVLQTLENSQEVAEFYFEIKNEFPRHSAFQRELKNVMGR